MKLKDGIVLRPFGPASHLEGKVGKHVAKWLIDSGKATADQFETEAESKKAKAAAAALEAEALEAEKQAAAAAAALEAEALEAEKQAAAAAKPAKK